MKCAINAVYFSIKKTLDKSISIEKISQNFEKFEGPPYSILDIVSILDEYSLKTLPSKLIPSTEVFMHRFNNGILYLKKPGRKIGHFSFCFRGKDGKLWIADPAFGDKCIEFTPESEIFKSFTGIILKIENPK